MKLRYTISIAPGIQYDIAADDTLDLQPHDGVVVRCERYEDAGNITACHDREPLDEAALAREHGGDHGRRIQGNGMPEVVRPITPEDEARLRENRIRAAAMEKTVLQQIKLHRLEMKMVSVHLVFDRSLLAVLFTAEGRVDFRELLRDLSKQLHIRVELRQIGVRDEAAVHGGLGCCGRPFCCATFLHDFQSINVKLAKEQGLSLNPANISGACGRLKCCLRYEADGYREMRQSLPRPGAHVDTPDGPGRVMEVNPLTRKIRVGFQGSGGAPQPPVVFAADDVKLKPAPPGTGKCPHQHCRAETPDAADNNATEED